jgi:hypothetical protein
MESTFSRTRSSTGVGSRSGRLSTNRFWTGQSCPSTRPRLRSPVSRSAKGSATHTASGPMPQLHHSEAPRAGAIVKLRLIWPSGRICGNDVTT